MESKFKNVVAGATALVATAASRLSVAAQDTAAAGNGGTATAAANGGAVSTGDINSGGNAGNAIAVGDTGGGMVCDKYGKCYWDDGDGSVAIDGGNVSSNTTIGISADGGTAIADASGGDDNFAFVS